MVTASLVLAWVLSAQAADGGPGESTVSPSVVAVLELRGRGVDSKLADSLLDVVAQEVAQVPRYRVLSRKDIEAILDEEARKQLTGCDSTSCVAELAGALNAEYLVAGELAALESGFLITLQFINHKYANVENRVNLTWKGAADQLPEVATAAAQLLVRQGPERSPGGLTLTSLPPGATVFVDERAASPKGLQALDVGVHAVRVSAPGLLDREFLVVIRSGQVSRHSGALDSVPMHRRPGFWVASVGGVGGCLTSVLLLVVIPLVVIPPTLLILFTGGTRVSAGGADPLEGAR